LQKDLIIETSSEGSLIALLEDQNLVEFHHEKVSDDFLVGNVYLGKVKKLLPALNAAFVDIGHEKDAFLHYLDLGPNFPTLKNYAQKAQKGDLKGSRLANFHFSKEMVKDDQIKNEPNQKEEVVVQLVKEPISTKGPRLSSEITLAGRFIILVPFKNNVSISKRITQKKERDRLRNLINGIRPKNFGVIVRTLAEGKSVRNIEEDLHQLLNRWDQLTYNLQHGKGKLSGEANRANTILRDLLNDSFNRILVDNDRNFEQLKEYISKLDDSKTGIVKKYRGKQSLFDHLNINRQIKSLFGKTVNLTGGAYLVIEHTEAMHVIDVNSGSKRIKGLSQEENAVKINLEAAEEVARQLRLRDMGGIIVVDFIDMRVSSNRRLVFEKTKELMASDRAKNTILPISKFGLMQITRQRVRPEIDISTNEKCPVCQGTGQITPSILIVDEIEKRIEFLLSEGESGLKLFVHPYVYAYLMKGFFNYRWKWFLKYKQWLSIQEKESFHLNEYQIINKKGIDLAKS